MEFVLTDAPALPASLPGAPPPLRLPWPLKPLASARSGAVLGLGQGSALML